jgi:transcriptional regulator with XRE-family HTH domain
MKANQKDFATNLKKFRMEKEMTQGQLAQRLGIHANHISRYERGESSPSAEVLKQFAEALDVSTDQLLFGDRKSYALDSIKDLELIKMVKRLEDLDEKQKETVKDLIACYLFRNDTKQRLTA